MSGNNLWAVELWSRASREWFVASWYTDGVSGCGLAVTRTKSAARKIRSALRKDGFRKSRLHIYVGDLMPETERG